MKLFRWIFALMLLSSTPAVYAQNENCCPDFCDPCSWFSDCDFSVYTEYLYWEVCRSDLINDDEYVNPDWDHGFRLGGRLSCDCWDLGLRYTYFVTDDEKDDEDYDIDYDVVDIELGYSFCADCVRASFRPFAGVKLAWIDEDHDDDDNKYRGYGLYFGGSSQWHLCDYEFCNNVTTISIIARGSYGILRSTFERNDNDKECLFVPYLDAFIGLNFSFCDLYCLNGDLSIGYEAQHWDWVETDSSRDTASLGLGGLVLHLGLGF